MDLFLSFLGGMIVMDLIWAWKLGLIQLVFNKIKDYYNV